MGVKVRVRIGVLLQYSVVLILSAVLRVIYSAKLCSLESGTSS